ncbi:MAG: hypothetical protein JKX70_01250 [Phycisphaerales bacterium]|nr:hypothetical protein [Phycisphaerales bacterium]
MQIQLVELANNRDRVDNLGVAARKRIEDEFDLVFNAQRIVDVMTSKGLI